MPKGRSLHIGVNYLDAAQYPFKKYPAERYRIYASVDGELRELEADYCVVGWLGPLGKPPEGTLACEKDADDMARIAAERGFDSRVLKTQEATSTAVRQAFEDAAAALEPGDIFFVTYSGHGAHAKDINGDEPEGYDETWCLYDRMFLDDEQRELYGRFADGVRIVVLMDCCHSGSGTRSAPSATDSDDAQTADIRGAPKDVDDWIYRYEDNQKRYDELQRSLPGLEGGRRNLAVVSMSACQDTQTAMGFKDTGGWFSNAVVSAFEQGKDDDNYVQFFDRVRAELEAAHSDAKQEPFMDHALLETDIEEAIRNGDDGIDALLAEEQAARPEAERAPIARLTAFLGERPFWIGDD